MLEKTSKPNKLQLTPVVYKISHLVVKIEITSYKLLYTTVTFL